jgi:lauroyl/myristoyl acyltransferase
VKPVSTDSGTPLVARLGYQPEQTVYVINAPQMFTEYLAQNNTKLVKQLPADWLQLFCKTQADFMKVIREYRLDNIRVGLWLCWPKKSSGTPTDLTDQTFRDVLLLLGCVDTKVCAIDETWSGLKFVRRKRVAGFDLRQSQNPSL